MYIILGINQDERGQGNCRPVYKKETAKELAAFITDYNGSISSLEIYEVKRLKMTIGIDTDLKD